MQRLAELCIKRPVFASMLILAMVVVGATAWMNLGVDRLPSVDLPTVTVRTTLPGALPELVEKEVTERVEEVVNTIEGITELRSISGPGSSSVTATFDLKRDIDVAAQDVRDRIATITRDLERVGADPPVVSKFNNDDQPIMTVAMAGPRSKRELTELADKVVKEAVERAGGVGEVRIVGGVERSMNLWLDADRLVALQVPVTAVRDAVLRQNVDVPGGNLTSAQKEAAVRTPGRLLTESDFNEMVITRINGQAIHLRDVGRAEDGTKEVRSVSYLNGVPNISLEIRRQSGANTIAVIEGAKEALERAQAQLPPDVKLEIIRDQSKYIYAALHEINVHLVLGSILASVVVLAFMRSFKSTIIAAVAIPTSVVATFGVMWALDFTLNSVTMLALVLMVGVVIDDAIVVLENIFRFVEEKKMNGFDAAREATKEIGLAVLATTLSLVVIFVPVSFMSSVSGRFLYQFGITAAVAVLVSLVVSFTLTPMMSARMFGHGKGDSHAAAKSRKGFYHWLDTAYAGLLRISMKARWAVALIAILTMGSSYFLYQNVRQEFVPSDVDEAEFQVNVNGPEGASLDAMREAMLRLDEDVRNIRGVRTVLTTAGGGWLGQVNSGNMYVRIAPHEERVFSLSRLLKDTLRGKPQASWQNNYTQRDVMLEVRKAMRKYPDLRGSVRPYPSFNVGGSFFDIDFVFRGPNLEELSKYAEQLKAMTRQGGGGRDGTPPKIPGIVDADTTLKLDKPELRIMPNRTRANELGVSPVDLGSAIRLLVGGDDKVSRFRDEEVGELYDVQIRLEDRYRNASEQMLSLYVPQGDGGLVELGNVATVSMTTSASRIDRLDRQRMVAVRGSVGGTDPKGNPYAQADRIAALRAAAAEMNLPPSITTTISGRARELERTFKEFLFAFLLSIVLMYIILAMNYESTVHPFTILLSIPLSVPFALLSLWATGGTLNLFSALGILVLFGVVKKNAILQIDHMNQLRERGMPRLEAIIQANRDRLRPILMTTLALVAGMLPLWLGTGPGAEERRAVAIVVIGGQTLCLLLTLLVTPVAYSLLEDGANLFKRKKQEREPVASGSRSREKIPA